MSRTSRIPHPPGSRFVAIHGWAVAHWGLAEAAIIGLLDFLDRAHAEEGQPLASRQRIIADLEGIVGRDAVDRGLRTLVDAGALVVHKTTSAGQRNLQTRVDYAICIDEIARILPGTPDFRSPGKSGNQEPREVLESGLKPGVPSCVVKEVENAAAARAGTRGLESAAAPSKQGKIRNVRESGIITWCQDDHPSAEKIENEHSAEEIGQAVSAVRASGKDPVPGLVLRQIERQRRDHEAARRRAAAEAAYQARLSTPPTVVDQAAAQRGSEILARIQLRNRTEQVEQ